MDFNVIYLQPIIDIPNNPCPKCGCPMADYTTPWNVEYVCEECSITFHGV